MRVTARRGMWGLGVALLIAACGQPSSGAATGPAPVVDPTAEVALLAVVEGRVTVRSAQGVEVEARPDMSLRRSDTVVTTPGSLAVVVLASGYVLKLEEDQATPVRALAHLDDPPPAESVAELFEKALGAEAFARVGGTDRLERIAGWNARRASGETPAPVAKLEAQPLRRDAPPAEEAAEPAQLDAPIAADPAGVESKDHERDDDGAGGLGKVDAKKAGGVQTDKAAKQPTTKKAPDAAGPADPLAPTPLPSKSSESSKRGSSDDAPAPPQDGPPGGVSPEAEASDAAVDLADQWIFETGPKEQVTRTSLPEALKSRRQALAQCLAGAAASELRLEVVGGVVKQVQLGGGKPAPACARELVNVRLSGVGGDGWMIVRVRR